MTVPKILAIFVVLLVVNRRWRWLTGLVYQLVARRARIRHRRLYLGWFILPAAIDALADRRPGGVRPGAQPQQICRLGHPVRLVRRRRSSCRNMGYSNPLYTYAATPQVPLSDFVGVGQLLERRGYRSSSTGRAVRGHPGGRRPSAVAARHRPRRCASRVAADAPDLRRHARWRSPARPRSAMAATGAYAYLQHQGAQPLRDLRRGREISAPTTRSKYLKYENAAAAGGDQGHARRPAVPEGAAADRRRPLRPQEQDRRRRSATSTSARATRTSNSSSSTLPARSSSPTTRSSATASIASTQPLAPGATATLTFHSRIWHRGFRGGQPGDRRDRERHLRQQ